MIASWKFWIRSLYGPIESPFRLAAMPSSELPPMFWDRLSSILESIRA